MSYGKIDPKLEAAHVSREEILARLDKLETDLDAAIAQVRRELKREHQQEVERVIKWWITPLT